VVANDELEGMWEDVVIYFKEPQLSQYND